MFKDKNLEQRFIANRYRRRDLATRILKRPRSQARVRARTPVGDYALLPDGARALLDRLWNVMLDLGRVPERDEVSFLPEIESQVGSLRRALRLTESAFDYGQLAEASAVRRDDLRLFFAMGHFVKRPAYRSLESRLQRDIKAFFGDYRAAQTDGLQLLMDAANQGAIRVACQEAAEQGMGWLNREGALHLHTTVVDRLPAVLRAYVGCGLLIYGEASEAQLIKVHSLSAMPDMNTLSF